MTDDINLLPMPRLQVPLIEADVSLLDIKVLARWCERTATDYARAAVLADREGRQQDELDAAWCAECGAKLETVRPGKHQHPTCSQAQPLTDEALLAERDQLAAALEAAREDAERYRLLRKGAVEDVAVVRGLGAIDYGMSAVVDTYSEEIDGDDLDAAIDAAMSKENSND